MEKSGGIRLQKFLAESGVASRRASEKLITEGNVKVNGKVIRELGTKVDPRKDKVSVDGLEVQPEKKQLFMFNKPAKTVCTMKDPQGRPCVGDYVKDLAVTVFPLGRLDFDVTGLLLLTNDGEYAEKLLHPRFNKERVYWAVVPGRLTRDAVSKLKNGIRLEDGIGKVEVARNLTDEELRRAKKMFRPFDVNRQTVVEVRVTEGRNHFVKRILKAVQYPVIQLCRVSFGPYSLGHLKEGEIRRVKEYK